MVLSQNISKYNEADRYLIFSLLQDLYRKITQFPYFVWKLSFFPFPYGNKMKQQCCITWEPIHLYLLALFVYVKIHIKMSSSKRVFWDFLWKTLALIEHLLQYCIPFPIQMPPFEPHCVPYQCCLQFYQWFLAESENSICFYV